MSQPRRRDHPLGFAEDEGLLIYTDLRVVKNEEGRWVTLNKNGFLNIVRDESRTLEEYKRLLGTKSIEPLQTFKIELGTKIFLVDGEKVKVGVKIAEWEQQSHRYHRSEVGQKRMVEYQAEIAKIAALLAQ